MKLTWLGHSCIFLEGSRSVLIDPFTGSGAITPDPDIVAVTHGHADHFGETLRLRKKTVAVNEIAKYLVEQGIDAEAMNIGGTAIIDGVEFTMTPAFHSSWLEAGGAGFYGGAAAGFVVCMDGVKVYHAGDTALFSDMKLIGDLYHPDIALLPIGGRYTMGPAEAMVAANFVGAPRVVPIHYNTWDVISQDAHAFRDAIERTTDLKVEVLNPGESLQV